MSLQIDAIAMFTDNYAWRIEDIATGKVAVVDPADEAAVVAAVEAAGGRLDLILLTHHHADHIAGADAVRARYGAPIVGAAADAARLPRLDQAVAAGDRVQLGTSAATVIDCPGHTVGHIAFYFPDGPALFCGDTLFSLGCGRLLEGTAAQMFHSLAAFAALPGRTRVYCGHEYTEANARFAVHADPTNAALRARAEAVRQLRAAGKPTVPSLLSDEMAENPFMRAGTVEALAALRSAKDTF